VILSYEIQDWCVGKETQAHENERESIVSGLSSNQSIDR